MRRIVPGLLGLWAVVTQLPLCPPARAQTGIFSTVPDWFSAPINKTTGIALGDVDRDGALDLACGNGGNPGSPNTLYRNDGGAFLAVPVWISGPQDPDGRSSLGDVDHDGDLDLVSVSTNRTKKVYYNIGGVLSATPGWESASALPTECSLLGDVDGDGYLDLVCGNNGDRNELYLSRKGSLPAKADWQSEPANSTLGVALGDIDGDGDLDLVCANTRSSTLYLNRGRVFETQPSWSSDPRYASRSVALGDLDGDGDLDAVFGNDGQSNTAYRNVGGALILESEPYWASDRADDTYGVALGDLDGDGDLDLVCGNTREPNSAYLNKQGTFSTSPDWSSQLSSATWEVALGDVDGDGDLDLVCGNWGESNTLYLNQSAPLASEPSWLSELESPTTDTALGDIDGDGDLDLACGNYNAASALYRNDEVGLSFQLDWASSLIVPTTAVALADLDDDGDLDLACANLFSENEWYRNEGGVPGSSPAWTDSARARSRAVAAGDVNGDGNTDLAFGNVSEPSTIYRSDQGTFSTTPDWLSETTYATYDLGWADVDGDGDPDLVSGSGSVEQPNVLYLNVGGSLDSTAWMSDVAGDTRGIALGDLLDADGDPDLVCANSGQANTLYRNENGELSDSPNWSTESQEASEDVALGDLDGDGDLDIVFANFGEANTAYRNDNGTLARQPFWRTVPANDSRSVSLGDLDGDGDLDAVFGNYLQSNTVYEGLRAPVFRHGPISPRYQLPNNGAHLRHVAVTADSVSVNLRHVSFTAIDVESDPFFLAVEYQFRGDPTWHPADTEASSGRLGPLSSSPSGVAGEFDWSVDRMPVDPRSVVLRLRVVEIPWKVSLIQHVAPYLCPVGPITPRRPVLATTTGSLELPTVSLGDTVSTVFTIENQGNEPLQVSGILLPSTEMATTPAPPFEVGVGESWQVELMLAPREILVPGDSLRIASNDPANPSFPLAVRTDIRDLDYETVLLTSTGVLPLGEAASLEVRPAPEVRLELGRLFFRPIEATESFTAISFAPLAGDFIAIIPGESVTERGLEYYVEVENSGVIRRDPPTAPDTLFSAAVAQPNSVATSARPTAGAGFLEGVAITVQVGLAQGAKFESGFLYFRPGGTAAYDSTAIERAGLLLEGVIPDSVVTARGVEYWARVVTATRTLTDPPAMPGEQPRFVQTTVPTLAEPSTRPGGRYRMISVPLQFGPEFRGNFADLLSDQREFQSNAGTFDPAVWRSFRYLGTAYAELTESAGAEFRPEPGRAFWLISRSAHQVDTAPVAGLSTPTGEPYAIPVAPGWNQIGDPFAFPVAWASITGTETISDRFAFDSNLGTIGQYLDEPPEVLVPFEGYFIYNDADQPVTLLVPPIEAPQPESALFGPSAFGSPPAASPPLGPPLIESVPVGSPPFELSVVEPSPPAAHQTMAGDPGTGWMVRITARQENRSDDAVVLGVRSGSPSGAAPPDRRHPPPVPGDWVQLSSCRANGRPYPGQYRRDLRSPGEEGYEWDLELRTRTPAATIRLSGWKGAELASGLCLVILDLEQSVRLEIEQPEYEVLSFGPDRAYRLSLIAGTREYVDGRIPARLEAPTAVVLDPNAPNPFHSATRLRFGLPAVTTVSLLIYNVRGERVATLLDGRTLSAGFHTAIWDGRDDGGRSAASGVYFSRLRVADRILKRRIVLTR